LIPSRASQRLRLGVNIDHVATVRNARGGASPDPVRAAEMVLDAGADGITAHLREDRRHIRDEDMARLSDLCRERGAPLNFEMAATDEMVALAIATRPHAVCLVPERREERTTEGGLDAAGQHNSLKPRIAALADAGCRVSLFIAADARQVEAARALNAPVIELHAGAYCDALVEGAPEADQHLRNLSDAALHADAMGIEIHAGHGIDFDSVTPIAAIPEIRELNIGHFLIGEAIFIGLPAAIARMRALMDAARGLA
jgi:pyridoxine 5-phosphate synthase